ncbi:hypothetical protein SELMODRAFT_418313 [Selaginella moellendorffii]|uniref:Uncharacterized protein n=1 Tax=Selaginella moellendorffii TaxID=88036 RepID=D8S5B3_SELML|nr:hypothetical protein SELMODRAFT_418313 [Selaginella moellendorffii]
MECMWVKRGDDLRLVPLEGGFFLVADVARHYGLAPESLAVGSLALIQDSYGKSRMTFEQIIGFARSCGLGDGSQENPLQIDGRKQPLSRREEEEEAAAAFAETPLGKAFDEAEEHMFEVTRVWNLKRARTEVFLDELREGIYGYRAKMRKSSTLEKEMKKFVCSVHIISSKRLRDRTLDPNTATGFATLIDPEGLCITVAKCVKELRDEMKIMVKFLEEDACYEYKISERTTYGTGPMIVYLEPVVGVNFGQCMYVDGHVDEFMDTLYTFGPSLEMVRGVCLDPDVALFGSLALQPGAPVFTEDGSLQGIVMNPKLGKLGRKGNNKITTTRAAAEESKRAKLEEKLGYAVGQKPRYLKATTKSLVELLDPHSSDYSDYVSELPRMEAAPSHKTLARYGKSTST